MLKLSDITKEYGSGASIRVEALRGVNLAFRKNEFVAVLGPSGCGKTTLLNIIGGLDRYTTGNMSIEGVPTGAYKDRDWDAYRNHSVGFVFQSYNLIPHQSVLVNVELALTLSGVGKAERRSRAVETLRKVGLGEHINKKPNQLSGGQMQRVAIARALVNDPEIVLADEPTGALDSETSVQVMDLLREVAKDRLVIMVTHNPDLAAQYATRVIRLLDGRVVDDSRPYSAEEEAAEPRAKTEASALPSMSAGTAFSLSLQNLLTKKARTLMIAFAGSIGIIGIALILSLSSGVQDYINSIESDALSSYPITIQSMALDSSSMLTAMADMRDNAGEPVEEGHIGTNTIMTMMYNTMLSEAKHNDLGAFRDYLEETGALRDLTAAIRYGYDGVFTVYNTGSADTPAQVYPGIVFDSMMGSSASMFSSSQFASVNASSREFWQELPGDESLWHAQYDLIAGDWPVSDTDVLLVVDANMRMNDLSLYAQGIKDSSTLAGQFLSMMSGTAAESESLVFSYDELLGLEFTALPTAFLYAQDADTGLFADMRDDQEALQSFLGSEGIALRVRGIVTMTDSAVTTVMSGSILYSDALTSRFLTLAKDCPLAAAQAASPDIDVTSGLFFSDVSDEVFLAAFDENTLPASQRTYLRMLAGTSRYAATARKYAADTISGETRAEALQRMGCINEDEPSSISIYPLNFEAKDRVTACIDAYNERVKAEARADLEIQYTDYVGILMSSVSTIVNAVTYALIAFVAISLIVSSIMIGVITYISVLERTKEIGVLRSIGASKRDISRVFNAETLIVGCIAGALGVLIAWLVTIPANAIVYSLSGIKQIAQLPALGAGILLVISKALTLIAGLIPSAYAAGRDPVVALRSE